MTYVNELFRMTIETKQDYQLSWGEYLSRFFWRRLGYYYEVDIFHALATIHKDEGARAKAIFDAFPKSVVCSNDLVFFLLAVSGLGVDLVHHKDPKMHKEFLLEILKHYKQRFGGNEDRYEQMVEDLCAYICRQFSLYPEFSSCRYSTSFSFGEAFPEGFLEYVEWAIGEDSELSQIQPIFSAARKAERDLFLKKDSPSSSEKVSKAIDQAGKGLDTALKEERAPKDPFSAELGAKVQQRRATALNQASDDILRIISSPDFTKTQQESFLKQHSEACKGLFKGGLLTKLTSQTLGSLKDFLQQAWDIAKPAKEGGFDSWFAQTLEKSTTLQSQGGAPSHFPRAQTSTQPQLSTRGHDGYTF